MDVLGMSRPKDVNPEIRYSWWVPFDLHRQCAAESGYLTQDHRLQVRERIPRQQFGRLRMADGRVEIAAPCVRLRAGQLGSYGIDGIDKTAVERGCVLDLAHLQHGRKKEVK